MTADIPMQDSQHQESKIQLGTWKKLFSFARAYPKHMVAVAILALLTGLADILFPLVTKYLIDAITEWETRPGTPFPSLAPYIAAYIGLTLLLCSCVWGFIIAVGFMKTAVAADIRTAGFANLQRLEFAYYDKRATGWLMSRMTSDCERLANIMAWGTLDILWAFTFLTGISIVLLALNWKVGLLVLTVVPLLAFASRFFQKRLLQASRKIRKINSTITADFNESIMGVLTTKSFGQQEPNLENFSGEVQSMYAASVRNAILSALYLPTVLTVGSLATAFVMVQGGLLHLTGAMSLGTLVAFLSYTRLMFEPMQQIAHIIGELQMAQASGERIVELLEKEPVIKDSPSVIANKVQQLETQKAGAADDGFPMKVGTIAFDSVGFSYGSGQGGDTKVLEGIDATIEPGETVALIGSTGGGKTTFISLLCRFYEPTEGNISIGGIDLQDRSLSWLQSVFGIVLQDPYLFQGSVRENILYGRLDASPEEIEEAAKTVGAHEFINRLDGGYDFDVGESGARLSQGERQLVSFARAILKDPAVLIMDEATSNVDSETEHHIQKGLERVLKGRTSFVIAHRLSTIENADRILVIEKGRILEQGSHAELLAKGGRYQELLRHQSLEQTGQNDVDWKVPT